MATVMMEELSQLLSTEDLFAPVADVVAAPGSFSPWDRHLSSASNTTTTTGDFPYTYQQQKILANVPRAAAAVSFACGLAMLQRSLARRRVNIFHRMGVGMSVHLILYASWNLYGPAAVPASTGLYGAHGTTATCTAMGFFLQVTAYGISFYYVFLSWYSYQAVWNNFQSSAYDWMEKWIHGVVHVFPVGSAVYLLAIEAFNPTGHLCWIASVPFGCGDEEESEVTCQRGPQNIGQVSWIFAGLPSFFVLIFPTIVMVVLWCRVKRRQQQQKQQQQQQQPHHHQPQPREGTTKTTITSGASLLHRMESNAVAKQAALYLLALYWSYLFTFINKGIQVVGDRMVYVTALLSAVNINLQGVWFFLIYRHFTTAPSKMPTAATGPGTNLGESADTTRISSSRTTEEGKTNEDERRHRKQQQQYQRETDGTFNIFDGTNAAGTYAEYICEGDSEDEREDAIDTQRWSSIQEYI